MDSIRRASEINHWEDSLWEARCLRMKLSQIISLCQPSVGLLAAEHIAAEGHHSARLKTGENPSDIWQPCGPKRKSFSLCARGAP